MAFSYTETADSLIYAERIPPGLRLLIAGFALAVLLIPLPFVRHANWKALSVSALLAGVVTLGSLALCLYLFKLALADGNRIEFIAARQQFVHSRQHPFALPFALPFSPPTPQTHGFDEVGEVAVKEVRPPDSWPSYFVELRLRQGPVLNLGAYPDEAQAQAQAARVRRYLQLEAQR